ncbi:ATP-dependent DNA helicase [Frankliniella fusca]|uniref:ATP-dependent DNA helicase n=1 Tax=Frankliniella fusca TaxID=407009 RepID=A0AAE1GVY0_9NEOP|nr:ATP-dependent DNA helicase [Frankliniella fusca]
MFRKGEEEMALEKASKLMLYMANVGAPEAILWDTHKEVLCEDLLERYAPDNAIFIDRALHRNGSSLASHGLPVVEDATTELSRQFLVYGVEAQQTFYDEWLPRLTHEQRRVLEHGQKIVLGKLPDSDSKVVFLDGPGGYGKTALLRTIMAWLRSLRKVPICVASSGIAALNMEGGFTAHSIFRLPLDLGGGVGTWNITNNTQRAHFVRAAAVVIFDEAPMAHRHLFEMLDWSLKDLMGNDLLFGGKPFLCSGDFRQIPPVVEKARTPIDTRTRGFEEYSQFLLEVGNGSISESTFGVGREAERLVPLRFVQYCDCIDELVESIYPAEVLADPDKAAERAILAPINTNVHSINDNIMAKLAHRVYELRSFDALAKDGDDGCDVPTDVLNEAKGRGVPDHVLRLKIGCVCLITRNLNVEEVTVEAISHRLVRVRKPNTSVTYGIPRISFRFSIVPGSPMEMTRRQFPLQVAYAISTHKSQGQTVKKVGVDLRTDCFTHGQLFVALSRVRNPDDLLVLVPSDRVHDGLPYTKNIVFTSLLQPPEEDL